MTSSDVNDYLREVTGEDITAKDFCTWHGTVLAAMALGEFQKFDSAAGAKRNIRDAIQKVAARLGHSEELQALKRLDDQARRLERTADGPSFDAFVAGERQRSASLDGRSVFGWEKDLATRRTGRVAIFIGCLSVHHNINKRFASLASWLEAAMPDVCLPAGTQVRRGQVPG